jgi:hypothetical protein
MQRLTLLSLLLAACASDTWGIEIVDPPDGTTITTADPITFSLRIDDETHPGAAEIFVDGIKVPDSEVGGACINYNGTSELGWTAASITNGTHVVQVSCIHDLVGITDEVTLVFARP